MASHIRIEKGGPVPDYVHFHRVRFQCIFCYRGRVRVVYEGQVRIDVVVLGALLWFWAHCCGPGRTVLVLGTLCTGPTSPSLSAGTPVDVFLLATF